jgi:hypothetical protein
MVIFSLLRSRGLLDLSPRSRGSRRPLLGQGEVEKDAARIARATSLLSTRAQSFVESGRGSAGGSHPALPRSTPTPTLPQDTGEGVRQTQASELHWEGIGQALASELHWEGIGAVATRELVKNGSRAIAAMAAALAIAGCVAATPPAAAVRPLMVPVLHETPCPAPALADPALPLAALGPASAPADTMRAYAAAVAILKGAVRERDAVLAGCMRTDHLKSASKSAAISASTPAARAQAENTP